MSRFWPGSQEVNQARKRKKVLVQGIKKKKKKKPEGHVRVSALLPLQRLLKSFSSLKDVGIVQVKVMRAEGLMAADVTGNTNVSVFAVRSAVRSELT